MGFGLAIVEGALAELHFIRPEKRVAFKARLKHLQRLGFPPGVNTGTGRAANYQGQHLFLLGLAFELLQLGLTPERVIKVIGENLVPIATAGRMVVYLLGKHEEEDPRPIFLYCDPSALNSLTADEGEDDASASFFYGGIGVMCDYLRDMGSKQPRLSLINTTALIGQMYIVLHQHSADDAETFKSELVTWLESYPENVDGDPEA
jgi:hypothetical protein